MKMSKRRALTVRMGQYEKLEATAWMEIDTQADADELRAEKVDPENDDEVTSFINDRLTELLEEDVLDAQAYTDDEDSFIHPYVADKYTQRK